MDQIQCTALYGHCSNAIRRSGIWIPTIQIGRKQTSRPVEPMKIQFGAFERDWQAPDQRIGDDIKTTYIGGTRSILHQSTGPEIRG